MLKHAENMSNMYTSHVPRQVRTVVLTPAPTDDVLIHALGSHAAWWLISILTFSLVYTLTNTHVMTYAFEVPLSTFPLRDCGEDGIAYNLFDCGKLGSANKRGLKQTHVLVNWHGSYFLKPACSSMYWQSSNQIICTHTFSDKHIGLSILSQLVFR